MKKRHSGPQIVAKLRQADVLFGQLLSTGDDVSGDEWDPRYGEETSFREKLFWLSVKACRKL